MYTATLEFGNLKGHDYKKVEQFATKIEAIDWLEREAKDRLCPSGIIVDRFYAVVYILCERMAA